jgi:peptidoglycan-associated lipoprotein
MSDLDLRRISSKKASTGLKQVVILFLAVVIGILISVSASNAQNAQEKEKIQKEDKAIAKNNLPAVSFERHEQICQLVAENLKNKKPNEPIELAPLYFTFNKNEIVGVDMDGLLMAVEYALQGRIILIEGHTDNVGEMDYNVKLSIKRVQKIRSLMHDMGVSDDQISIMGYGEEIAQHNNQTLEGRQLNRRVDFKAF